MKLVANGGATGSLVRLAAAAGVAEDAGVEAGDADEPGGGYERDMSEMLAVEDEEPGVLRACPGPAQIIRETSFDVQWAHA